MENSFSTKSGFKLIALKIITFQVNDTQLIYMNNINAQVKLSHIWKKVKKNKGCV